MDLLGKTALVTGSAKRVGRVIALTLAEAGANVIINYNHSAEAAEATAAEAEAIGVGALAISADVGNYEQVEAMVSAATGAGQQRFELPQRPLSHNRSDRLE